MPKEQNQPANFSYPPTGKQAPEQGSKEVPEKEEKLKFLKRAEIRTMQKDLSHLREEEARKEREKIIRIKEEKELQKERKIVEKIRKIAEKRAKKEKILPSKPFKPRPEKKVFPEVRPEKKPPSHFEKVFIRVALAVFIFLILVLVFALVYDWHKLLPEEKPAIEKVTEETVKEKAEESLPPALIPFKNTKVVEISSWDDLPQTISGLVTAPLGENEFIRIVIKNATENKFLTLEEFLKAFEIKAPEDFPPKLTGRFDLYVFARKEVNRVGFAVEIKNKEGLPELLKSWEKTMESDFENLSEAEGKKFPAPEPNFKEKNYRGNIFSYITFSPLPDYFGICYGMLDDYLIITSSCHNTLDLYDLLSPEYEH